MLLFLIFYLCDKRNDLGTISPYFGYSRAFACHHCSIILFRLILQIYIIGIIVPFHFIYIRPRFTSCYLYLTIRVALVIDIICWLYPNENKFRLILSNLTLSYRSFPPSTHHLDQWHNWHVFESLTQRTNFIGSAPIRPFGSKSCMKMTFDIGCHIGWISYHTY